MAALVGANPALNNLTPDWLHAEHSTGVSYFFIVFCFDRLG